MCAICDDHRSGQATKEETLAAISEAMTAGLSPHLDAFLDEMTETKDPVVDADLDEVWERGRRGG